MQHQSTPRELTNPSSSSKPRLKWSHSNEIWPVTNRQEPTCKAGGCLLEKFFLIFWPQIIYLPAIYQILSVETFGEHQLS